MIDDTIGNAKTGQPPSNGGELGHIDQYELVRELGGGGFGTVFLAKDTVAGIEVAVKGLPPFVKNNREELENIRDNFALVSRLTHTNIAKALVLHPSKDVFYSSEDVRQKLRVLSGDTLMVMEYAPGVTLSKWRKQFPRGKVPFDRALSIVRQIASALDYAHGQKILHRDIKPANIMVETRDDKRLVVRVLDFGLAAEIRSSMGRVSREIHDTSGTRPYMAPEQWEGARQGPATDQYALAVLFHELVTGSVPFASVFTTGEPVVMAYAVLNKPFKAPDEFPRSVRRALEKALSKKPAERFANCCDFVKALEEERHNIFLTLLLVAALLSALCGVCVVGWGRHDDSTQTTGECDTLGQTGGVSLGINDTTNNPPKIVDPAPPVSTNVAIVISPTNEVPRNPIAVTNSPVVITNDILFMGTNGVKKTSTIGKTIADSAHNDAVEGRRKVESAMKTRGDLVGDEWLADSWFNATNQLKSADSEYALEDYHKAAADYRKAEAQFDKILDKLKGGTDD